MTYILAAAPPCRDSNARPRSDRRLPQFDCKDSDNADKTTYRPCKIICIVPTPVVLVQTPMTYSLLPTIPKRDTAPDAMCE